MTSATNVILIAEKYYTKIWLGDGTAPTTFKDPVAKDGSGNPLTVTPVLGWFYVDATTGKFYIYNGSTWTESGTWSGAGL